MNRYEKFTLLGVFHYVLAGAMALFGCFPLIHVTTGVMMLTGGFAGPNPPPEWMGLFFVAAGATASVFMWGLAAATALAGHYLRTQRRHTFCVVVAAIECLNMPLGTILGVFTIMALVEPGAKEMFQRPSGGPGGDAPAGPP